MFPLLILLLLNLSKEGHCASYAESNTLLNSLLIGYNKNVRPVIDQDNPVDVSLSMRLFSISQFNEVSQTLSVTGAFFITWTDEAFVWNPSDHNGITMLNPDTNQVWVPLLGLGNSASAAIALVDTSISTQVAIQNTGSSNWFFTVSLESHCKMIMTKFPYDRHTCNFQIYPLTYTMEQISLSAFTSQPALDFFVPSGEWELVTSLFSTRNYTSFGELYSFLELSLTLQRKPVFFVVNLLFPTCALSFLNILVFILPADSGEKVGYSITVLLSVMLFMGVSSEVLPPTSDVVPLITQYLTSLTIISILSVIATVIILIYHHEQDKEEKRKNVIFSVLGRMKNNLASKITNLTKAETKDTKVSRVYPSDFSKPKNPQDMTYPKTSSTNYSGSCEKNGPIVSTMDDDLSIEGKGNDGMKLQKDSWQRDEKLTVIDMVNNNETEKSGTNEKQPCKRSGNWSRLFDHQVKSPGQQCNDSERPPPCYSLKKENRGSFISKNLDMIFFLVFLFVWVTITIAYMVALFT